MERRHFLALALAPAGPAFTDELWSAIAPIYSATLAHPFLKGLQDGSLPRDRFQFYLTQDALYLGAYSDALRILARKSPNAEWRAQFEKDATEAVEVEKQMHGQILASYGVTAAQIKSAAMAPTNYAYTNHLLLACTRQSFAEGLAAMLPCYWIYWEVGKQLQKRGSVNKDYQRWIAQYADPAYGKTVARVLDVMNRSVTPAVKANAKDLFIKSSRYEYQFWDMAWRLERWQP